VNLCPPLLFISIFGIRLFVAPLNKSRPSTEGQDSHCLNKKQDKWDISRAWMKVCLIWFRIALSTTKHKICDKQRLFIVNFSIGLLCALLEQQQFCCVIYVEYMTSTCSRQVCPYPQVTYTAAAGSTENALKWVSHWSVLFKYNPYFAWGSNWTLCRYCSLNNNKIIICYIT
jgi:hypothetical protein